MAKKLIKTVLWENTAALMRHRWGKENLNRLARELSRLGDSVSPASMSRIKDAEQSTGIGMIADIAKVFRIEPWQLLLPGLDPARPQQVANDEQKNLLLHAHATLPDKLSQRLVDIAADYLELNMEPIKTIDSASGNS